MQSTSVLAHTIVAAGAIAAARFITPAGAQAASIKSRASNNPTIIRFLRINSSQIKSYP